MRSERREKTNYSACGQGMLSGRCGNHRAGQGAKLGRAGCGAHAGEENGCVEWVGDWARPNRPAMEEKERRKEEKGRDAGPPAGQRGKGRKRKGQAQNWGWTRMEEGNFFQKQKPFPNLFSLFSILSQIKIEFEFNFKSTSPTLNQKQFASA